MKLKNCLPVLFILAMNEFQAQTVQLIPDSCTFCLFKVSDGGTGWYEGGYGIFPNEDTLVLGNQYVRINFGFDPRQPFAIRQLGNKLMGVVADSVSEYLLMDFDVNESDTIHDLYSEGFFYDAVVLDKDSVLVNNGVYHHFMRLKGIGYHTSSGFVENDWEFTWNERGLCSANESNSWDLGGVLYNVPTTLYAISAVYAFPDYCTTDPIYSNPTTVICDSCNARTNSLYEFSPTKLKISPNPVETEMVILPEDTEIKKITIYDVYGLVVKEQLAYPGEVKVQVSELYGGIYFLKVETNKEQFSYRFVKV